MQTEIKRHRRRHADVPAGFVIGAVFPGRHPGDVDHEGKDNLDGAVTATDDAVHESLAVIREATGQGRGSGHEEGRGGAY